MHFGWKIYYVYIVTNRSKTLYTGVTNNLERRMWEHKHGTGSTFASRYKIDRLVYYESFDDIRNAIDRGKQIKGLLRIKKIALMVSRNPAWRDLSEEWYKLCRSMGRRVHRSFASLRMTELKLGMGRRSRAAE